MSNIKQLKIGKKHFISDKGYIFKIYGSKKFNLPITIKNSIPLVRIVNKNYNLIHLMVEYFGEKQYSEYDLCNYRFQFKKDKYNNYPFENIRIAKTTYKEIEDIRLVNYKCIDKSNSANSRVGQSSTISPYDVFNSLLRFNFKCTYCLSKLNKNTWELDHFHPLSKGGLNISTNIAPSCKHCNRLKGNL
tara:strand:- start:2351 stop:2917 length:567 start_codon:yes stop_codon:yes gene_type:complete